jgi:hypothetical protein
MMKVKGIKRGNTIELIDLAIDIPDGTEITVIIEDQPPTSPEDYLERLRRVIAEPFSDDFLEAMAVVEHERQLSSELARLNLQLQATADDTPLTDLIGSAPGSFATPEEADQFIREQRDEWDY